MLYTIWYYVEYFSLLSACSHAAIVLYAAEAWWSYFTGPLVFLCTTCMVSYRQNLKRANSFILWELFLCTPIKHYRCSETNPTTESSSVFEGKKGVQSQLTATFVFVEQQISMRAIAQSEFSTIVCFLYPPIRTKERMVKDYCKYGLAVLNWNTVTCSSKLSV